MEPDELLLELEGPHGEIDARAVAEGLDCLLRLLDSLPGDDPASSGWRLSVLELGSAKLAVRGNPVRVATAVEGIRQLQSNPALPTGWSNPTLQALVDLKKVASRPGVEGIKLAGIERVSTLSDEVTKNAKLVLQPSPPSLGSIRGVLYRYNDDRKNAGLKDERTGLAVTVSFPPGLAYEIRASLTSEVVIWGEVQRNSVGKIEHINAEGLKLQTAPSPQSVESIAGLFGSEWTAGLSSVDWVRRQRDE